MVCVYEMPLCTRAAFRASEQEVLVGVLLTVDRASLAVSSLYNKLR